MGARKGPMIDVPQSFPMDASEITYPQNEEEEQQEQPIELAPPPVPISSVSNVRKKFSAIGEAAGAYPIDEDVDEAVDRAVYSQERVAEAGSELENQIVESMNIAGELMAEKSAAREDLREEKAMFQEEALNKIEGFRLEAKYANSNLNADEIRRLESIKNTGVDPDSDMEVSEAQRKEASDTLQRASTVGDRRTGMQKVAAAIAVGLGAYASAINKTPNYALKLIQQAIGRDIQEQKARFGRKKGVVTEAEGSYEKRLKQFGDKELATMAEYDSQLEQAKMKIGFYKAKMQNAQQIANADQTAAMIEQEQQKNVMGMQDRMIDQQLKAAHGEMQARRDAHARQMQKAAMQAEAAPAEFMPENVQPIKGTMPNPKMVKDVSKNILSPYYSSMTVLDEIIADREEYGAELFNRHVVTRQGGRSAVLQGAIRQMLGWGARLETREEQALEQMANKDPTQVDLGTLVDLIPFSGDKKDITLAKFKVLRNMLSEYATGKLRASNLEWKPNAPSRVFLNAEGGTPQGFKPHGEQPVKEENPFTRHPRRGGRL